MPLSIISNMIKWLPTPHVLYSWPYSPTPNANVIPILWWWHVGAPAPHAHSIQSSWHIFHLRPCNEIKRAISHGSRIIKVHKKFVLQFVRVIWRGNLSVFFNLPLRVCVIFPEGIIQPKPKLREWKTLKMSAFPLLMEDLYQWYVFER